MGSTKAKLIRKAAVIDGHRQGLTIKELEKKYGIGSATIKTYLREERINTAERKQTEQQKRIAARAEAIKEDAESGLTARETADKEGTSYSTVLDTLRAYRTSQVSPEILYSEIGMVGVRKRTIRRWAEKQAGRTINTPDGQMLVTAVYPYTLECLRRTGKREFKTSYTHGEVFYINER